MSERFFEQPSDKMPDVEVNQHDPQPAFPPELFQSFIDILASRPSAITLTPEQLTTLSSCSLVCKMFLPIARSHIFRSIQFGLEGDRLDRLTALLDETPIIKIYIQQLRFELDNYSWPHIPEHDMDRKADLFLNLPSVQCIFISYSSGNSIQRLSTYNDVGSMCIDIITACATRGTLRSLTLKKMISVPFPVIRAVNTLTSLSLDRCNLPSFTEPFVTVKSLSLRKIPTNASSGLSVAILSFFPNLESLCVVRTAILPCTQQDLPAGSSPSFGITRLILEQCSEYFYSGSDDQHASVSTLLQYFYSEAEKKSIKPFQHLTTLGMIMWAYSDLSVIESLLRDTAGTLQSFSVSAQFTPSNSIADFVRYLRVDSSHTSILLRRSSLNHLHQSRSPTITSYLDAFRLVTSFYPSSPWEGVLDHPKFIAAQDSSKGVHDEIKYKDWTMWVEYMSSVLVLENLRPVKAELYVAARREDIGDITSSEPLTDSAIDAIASSRAKLVGTSFDNLNDAQGCTTKIVLCL